MIVDTYIDFAFDGLNKEHLRNISNTPKEAYNCGGYALGTFSWYCPYAKDSETYEIFDNFFIHLSQLSMQKVTKDCVDFMLTDFPGMRQIEKVTEASRDETVIAFRLSSDGDFHYVKRFPNGQWRHKRGRNPHIFFMTTEEVLSDCWCERYNGPLVLLAVREVV